MSSADPPRLVEYAAAGQFHFQPAEPPLGVDGQGVRALEGQRDTRGVGAGGDHEVVLGPLALGTVDDVDALVDAALHHAAEGGSAPHPALGVVAEEVVDPARKRLGGDDLRRRAAPHKHHAKALPAVQRAQVVGGTAFVQDHVVARPAGNVGDVLGELAPVALEEEIRAREPPGLFGGGHDGAALHPEDQGQREDEMGRPG